MRRSIAVILLVQILFCQVIVCAEKVDCNSATYCKCGPYGSVSNTACLDGEGQTQYLLAIDCVVNNSGEEGVACATIRGLTMGDDGWEQDEFECKCIHD